MSNFSNNSVFYNVVFKDGSYGLEWQYEGKKCFVSFTSFPENASIEYVSNIHDVLPEEYYTMCDSDEMAREILTFIRNKYQESKDKGQCTQKYIDALERGIRALHSN